MLDFAAISYPLVIICLNWKAESVIILLIKGGHYAMHSRSKLLVLFVTAVIIALIALAGFTRAVEGTCKLLAVALANLSFYFHSGQCRSCIRYLVLVFFPFLMFLLRTLLLPQQH
jgi:hypothetical protein